MLRLLPSLLPPRSCCTDPPALMLLLALCSLTIYRDMSGDSLHRCCCWARFGWAARPAQDGSGVASSMAWPGCGCSCKLLAPRCPPIAASNWLTRGSFAGAATGGPCPLLIILPTYLASSVICRFSSSLCRRGYRQAMHRASLNESAAAGILYLSGWGDLCGQEGAGMPCDEMI